MTNFCAFLKMDDEGVKIGTRFIILKNLTLYFVVINNRHFSKVIICCKTKVWNYCIWCIYCVLAVWYDIIFRVSFFKQKRSGDCELFHKTSFKSFCYFVTSFNRRYRLKHFKKGFYVLIPWVIYPCFLVNVFIIIFPIFSSHAVGRY